jgi:hypothetical protein
MMYSPTKVHTCAPDPQDSVVAIFKERKNMASSLKDTDSIVHTLEFGIGCVFHFLFFAVYLLVWNVDIMKGFDTFSATVLALTFVFGNSVRWVHHASCPQVALHCKLFVDYVSLHRCMDSGGTADTHA